MTKNNQPEERFIVKVQISIFGMLGTIVYNEDKSALKIWPRSVGEKLLEEGEVKGFFYAHRVPTKEVLAIDERAPDQDW